MRKRVSTYMVLGIVAGLFLSACVGVAAGKIDLAGSGQVAGWGPVADVFGVAGLEFLGQTTPQIGMRQVVDARQVAVYHPLCSRGGH